MSLSCAGFYNSPFSISHVRSVSPSHNSTMLLFIFFLSFLKMIFFFFLNSITLMQTNQRNVLTVSRVLPLFTVLVRNSDISASFESDDENNTNKYCSVIHRLVMLPSKNLVRIVFRLTVILVAEEKKNNFPSQTKLAKLNI